MDSGSDTSKQRTAPAASAPTDTGSGAGDSEHGASQATFLGEALSRTRQNRRGGGTEGEPGAARELRSAEKVVGCVARH